MTDFTFTGSIEFDTIAASGFYDLSASGAQGGSATNGHIGGLGAAVSGDIYIASGTVLEIIVGGSGVGGLTSGGGGGGGGSFIFETLSGGTLDPVIIAGGGGGAGGSGGGGGGMAGPTGGNGSGILQGQGGMAGMPGEGSKNLAGGGGGGYTGGVGAYYTTGGGNVASSGQTLATTFAGGAGGIGGDGGKGGLGGGGGGGSGDGAGGGGGGYGGGGGGGVSSDGYYESGGGGGGSYDSDLTDISATAATHSGAGEVSIVKAPETFAATGSIQYETIAASGIYDLTADGAQGGAGTHGVAGGLGAAVGGDIYLAAGTVLEIVVGGAGGTQAGAGGGGGGSFIFETLSGGTLVPILIAGGGGGADSYSGGGEGTIISTGGTGGGFSGGKGGMAGAPGLGGYGTGGGGGGGYTGGAGSSYTSGGNTVPSAAGANAGATFDGGSGGISEPAGGFGGGGGGAPFSGGGGGGGGGYGGGGGGGYTSGGYGYGGGGGSYIDPLFTNTFANAGTISGDGTITLDLVELLCYLHGTRILTPTGPAPVESLKIGDTVVTRFGGIRPIKWIGRQTYAPQFIAPEKWPVCVRAGALGEYLPTQDLYVSPGHSMLLGDILVLASNLINTITITQTPPTSEVAYFQLDLGTHDCVLAEGAWSETYADAPGLRAQFHNAAEFEALYPEIPPPEQLTLCAPRPEHGPRLEAALRPIAEIAAEARMNEPPHRRMG